MLLIQDSLAISFQCSKFLGAWICPRYVYHACLAYLRTSESQAGRQAPSKRKASSFTNQIQRLVNEMKKEASLKLPSHVEPAADVKDDNQVRGIDRSKTEGSLRIATTEDEDDMDFIDEKNRKANHYKNLDEETTAKSTDNLKTEATGDPSLDKTGAATVLEALQSHLLPPQQPLPPAPERQSSPPPQQPPPNQPPPPPPQRQPSSPSLSSEDLNPPPGPMTAAEEQISVSGFRLLRVLEAMDVAASSSLLHVRSVIALLVESKS